MTASEKLEALLKEVIDNGADKVAEIKELTEKMVSEEKEEVIKCRKIFKKYLTIIKKKMKNEKDKNL